MVFACVCVSWDLVPELSLSNSGSDYVESSILRISSSQPLGIMLLTASGDIAAVVDLDSSLVRVSFLLFSFLLLIHNPPLESSLVVVVVDPLQADTPKADTSS